MDGLAIRARLPVGHYFGSSLQSLAWSRRKLGRVDHRVSALQADDPQPTSDVFDPDRIGNANPELHVARMPITVLLVAHTRFATVAVLGGAQSCVLDAPMDRQLG